MKLLRSGPLHLALIVLVGGILRLWGILHGLGDGLIYHADAHWAAFSAWHLHLGGPLREARFGAAHGFLSWLAVGTADLVGRIAGYPVPWSFPLVASALAVLGAVAGTLTILAAYVLATWGYDRRVGLLAAAFVALSPLHTLHSHYPYRDVPMVLALTLTLALCVRLAIRPRLLTGMGVAVGAALTIALKTGGLVVVAPVVTALGLAWRRPRWAWGLGATLAVGLVTLVGLSALLMGQVSPLASVVDRARFAWWFLKRFGPIVWYGTGRTFPLLADWLGWPTLVAALLGLAFAVWRHRRADVVLVMFLVPGFFAAAAIPWMDERFFVYLVPAAGVVLATFLVEAYDRAGSRRGDRPVVAALILALLATNLGRSAWQDILLTLPDTRGLSGRWFAAHIPRSTRVGLEGYYPLGVNEWPRATFFRPFQPVSWARAASEVLVTSSLEHGRYLEPRHARRYPPALETFFRTLPLDVARMRTFNLLPLGFAHPDITVYAARLSPVSDAPALFLPRPYDPTWNGGVAFLDPGPYDRDDRTLTVGGAQAHDMVLVSQTPIDEIAVFVANGPEGGQIRVDVGWARQASLLASGEWRVFRFRPRWWWPGRPALYGLSLALLPEGRSALVQIRAGAREIGEAYAAWGRWPEAVPYLERALAARPGDGEALLLLGTAYREIGRLADARRIETRLEAEATAYVATLRRLGSGLEPGEAWTAAFERATGLDVGFLTAALTRVVGVESVLAQGRLGGDPATPGGTLVVFQRGTDSPGVILNGPKRPRPLIHLAPGAYRARFSLRGGPERGRQETAWLRVFAERRLLAARPVTADELGDGRRGLDVVVPFLHDGPPTPMAVQVEATGGGSFAVEQVRIEPDLPGTLRQRWRALEALGG